MFIKVNNVEPLHDLTLRVTFENGITKRYDVKPLLEHFEDFKPLENAALFKGVKTDLGGYGISWNDYIDLECTELWDNGVIEREDMRHGAMFS